MIAELTGAQDQILERCCGQTALVEIDPGAGALAGDQPVNAESPFGVGFGSDADADCVIGVDDRSRAARRDRQRSADAALKAWEQACRQRWRALLLAIKAKLEAVAAGIAQFEDEFLAYVVDPTTNGTVGDLLRPQLEQRYLGQSTTLLGLPGPAQR